MAAGAAVDQLARDYAAQPVLFLEQNVDTPFGVRQGRWWVARNEPGVAYLPLMMVDSGYRISSGYTDYYHTYKSMVDAALARPPQAHLAAFSRRVGDRLRVEVQLTNLSGVTLSSAANEAAVHVIVWEEAHVGVTDRFVRGVAWDNLAAPLAHGARTTMTLETEDLQATDWAKVHAVALLDYRPAGHEGPFDMLQAAQAFPADLPLRTTLPLVWR